MSYPPSQPPGYPQQGPQYGGPQYSGPQYGPPPIVVQPLIAQPVVAQPIQPPGAKRSGMSYLPWILGGVGLVLVFCTGLSVLFWFQLFHNHPRTGTPTSTLSVGDCLNGQSEDTLHEVSCASSYEWVVVGVVPGVTESGADSACDGYPTATNVYWLGVNGGSGKAYCLAPAN